MLITHIIGFREEIMSRVAATVVRKCDEDSPDVVESFNSLSHNKVWRHRSETQSFVVRTD